MGELFSLLFSVLHQSRAKAVPRKCRLTVCAATRIGWDFLADDRLKNALTVGEQFAEGQAKSRVLASARAEAARAARELRQAFAITFNSVTRSHSFEFRDTSDYDSLLRPDDEPTIILRRAIQAAHMAVFAVEKTVRVSEVSYSVSAAQILILPLPSIALYFADEEVPELSGVPDTISPRLRCIFGNPFRPVKLLRKWLTPTVRGIADGMTADGAFDRLPVLADALEEAGCDHPDVLAHARGPGPHVRGCWVVDLVRGVHWQPRRA